MTQAKSGLFLSALKSEILPCPPVWMMRQAGRYHSHYQKLRAKHSFDELCKIPELASRVAMGPIQDFDFDAAILFSDLLFPLEALGLGLTYTDHGPKLGKTLTPELVKSMPAPFEAAEFMSFQKRAMQLTKSALPSEKGLIGFVGGVWTLFVYAVEGSHSGNLEKSKQNPEMFSAFANVMVPFLKRNIQLQLEGGADVVMIFDTAAGELDPLSFNRLIVPTLQTLTQEFNGKLGYYGKNMTPHHFQHDLFKAGTLAGQGFDHRFDLSQVLKQSHKGFIQGNFDQVMLKAPTDVFKKYLIEYLKPLKDLNAEQRRGWVCGLGHGVLPQTPESHVKHFVDFVRETFR